MSERTSPAHSTTRTCFIKRAKNASTLLPDLLAVPCFFPELTSERFLNPKMSGAHRNRQRSNLKT